MTDETENMRRCIKCKSSLTLEQFTINKKGEHHKTCNTCCIKKKEFYETNKEAIAKQHQEYRERDKEVISQKDKEYKQQNKEQIAERRKEYKEKNKEQIAERGKEYRKNNADKIREYREKGNGYTMPTVVANPQELKVCSACKKAANTLVFSAKQ